MTKKLVVGIGTAALTLGLAAAGWAAAVAEAACECCCPLCC